MSVVPMLRPRYRIEASSFATGGSVDDRSAIASIDGPDDGDVIARPLDTSGLRTTSQYVQRQHSNRFLQGAKQTTPYHSPSFRSRLDLRRSRSQDPQESVSCQERLKHEAITSSPAEMGIRASTPPLYLFVVDVDKSSPVSTATLENSYDATSLSATPLTADKLKRPVRPSLSTTRQHSYSPLAAAFLRHSSEEPTTSPCNEGACLWFK